ncbi:MAG: outer membrane protein assembly factor BamC [Gallionellaceae bacterium]|jgi:outer membrane protein assembly factor BamC
MKISNITFLVLAALTISACSTDSKRIDYKVASIRVPALEVPPDLTNIIPNEQYSIPGGDDALVASYSDYTKSTSTQAAQEVAILPEFGNVKIEHNDNQRWVAINGPADAVWPTVRAFWLDLGFQLKVENPAAGIMETDWQENRGNTPQSGLRTLLAKTFDSLKPAGQRDQYLIRFERNAEGDSTRIYITRHVMKEVKSSGAKESTWTLHDVKDAEIENAVMQLLLVKLGGTSTATPPLASDLSTASAVPPVATVALKETSETKVIQINETFDKCWRKVGLALDKARLTVEDIDRSKGQYLLMNTLASKDKKAINHQVIVRENAAGCEVSARDTEGKNTPESLQIIESVFQHIEK